GTRYTRCRGARCRAGRVGGIANPQQTTRILELRDLNLAEGLLTVRCGGRYRAVLRDGNRSCIRWNCDVRCEKVTFRGDQLAVGVLGQVTGARVTGRPVGKRDLKEALPVDGEIERLACRRQRALRE